MTVVFDTQKNLGTHAYESERSLRSEKQLKRK